MNTADERLAGKATIAVGVISEAAYGLVCDVTRLPELSPECYRCDWADGGHAREGAIFVGHNRAHGHEWSTVCQVTSADPGRRFAFETGLAVRKFTRWCYQFAADGTGGTVVTETFEILDLPPRFAAASPLEIQARLTELQDGLRHTLFRLKQILEHEAATSPDSAPDGSLSGRSSVAERGLSDGPSGPFQRFEHPRTIEAPDVDQGNDRLHTHRP